MSEMNHFDSAGNAIMVDVSEKSRIFRQASAEGSIKMSRDCFNTVRENKSKKGDVLTVARIAGIAATKQTGALIPLCHNICVENATVDFKLSDADNSIKVTCNVKTTGKTGVEMEALTGVSVTLLTIYDMCKAVDKNMEIKSIRLVKKTAGKSGGATVKLKD